MRARKNLFLDLFFFLLFFFLLFCEHTRKNQYTTKIKIKIKISNSKKKCRSRL